MTMSRIFLSGLGALEGRICGSYKRFKQEDAVLLDAQSMRGLCREEDYAFLGMSERTTEEKTEGAAALEGDWRDKKEERVRRQLEREQQDKNRLREIEESKKEQEQQWRTRVAELTSSQEKTLQDRLTRLRRFREFQRKVLEEESGNDSAGGQTDNQLLTKM